MFCFLLFAYFFCDGIVLLVKFFYICIMDTEKEMHILCRKASSADFDEAYKILRDAAKRMIQLGRRQWDENYPQKTDLMNDLAVGDAYVLECSGKVVAYAVVSFAGEPAYDALTDGLWLTNGSYAVVHRMAVSLQERRTGLAALFFKYVEEMCVQRGVCSIKVDTNYDNVEMLGLLERLGFVKCGTVFYDREGGRIERLAFEKVL